MIVNQTTLFGKQKKKLHANQVEIIDEAVQAILKNPHMSELKKGDLQGVRVHKFKMQRHAVLLAYTESKKEMTLLSLGSHENYYRNLKKQAER